MTQKALIAILSVLGLNVLTTGYNAFQTHNLYQHFKPEVVLTDSIDSVDSSSKSIGVSMESPQQWEYKVVSIKNEYIERPSTYLGLYITVKYPGWQSTITKYINQGWELISAIPIVETELPNFTSDYATGIKSFVYTSEVRFIFKRRSN